MALPSRKFLRRFKESGPIRYPVTDRLHEGLRRQPLTALIQLSRDDYIAYLIEMARLGKMVKRAGVPFWHRGHAYEVQPSPSVQTGRPLFCRDPDAPPDRAELEAVWEKLRDVEEGGNAGDT